VINIVCKSCGTAIRTSGEYDEVDSLLGEKSAWYPDQYPCPTCGGKSEMVLAIDNTAFRSLDLHDLTPEEAFAAFNGLGLPEERECGPMAVKEAFKCPVREVKCDLIRGTNRTVLRSIEFEDGTRMYFGASSYGCTVYRIARRNVEEVQGA